MKFVIDGNSLGQLAEALAGVSLQKGVKAGLQNQMLGAELDKMRFEQDRAFRQQQARDSLLGGKIAAMFPNESARTHENLAYALGGAKPVRGFRYDENGGLMTGADGLPLPDDDFGLPESLLRSDGLAAKAGLLREYADTARQLEAFGLDGAAAAKLWGGVEEAARSRALGDEIAALARSGDTAQMNHLIAARDGKTYQRFKPDAHGQVYTVDNGSVAQTPVSLGKVALMETQGGLNVQKAATEQARQGLLGAQQYTEGFRPALIQAQTNNQNAAAWENQAHAGLYGAQTQAVGQEAAAKAVERGFVVLPDGSILPVDKPKGLVKFTAPTPNEEKLFVKGLDPATGRPVTDYALRDRVVRFAQDNGFANVTEAMPAYRQHMAQANMWNGDNADAVINEALQFAPSNKLGAAGAQQVVAQPDAVLLEAPQGGWLNPKNLPNAHAYSQNLKSINQHVGIKPNMSSTQKLERIAAARNAGRLDAETAEQLIRAHGLRPKK